MTPDLLFDAPDLPIHVPDDPAGRLDMRRQFYEEYGFGKIERYGFGTSELQFLEWEVRRGVLHPGSGSAWWRAVNADLICDAARAAALFQAKFDAPVSGAVKCWLTYLREPSPRTWYRAHNASIVSGYLAHADLARQEEKAEQAFINIVLYRLLFAQSMVEEDAPGLLAEVSRDVPFGLMKRFEQLIADPRSMSVDLLVRLHDFYPVGYPATAAEIAAELGRTDLGDLPPEAWFDEDLIRPGLSALYQRAAWWLEIPALVDLVAGDRPVYPGIGGAAR